jgi:hypothetical protein
MRSYKIADWDGRCISCGEASTSVRFGKGKAGTCNACSKINWERGNQLKIRCQRLYGGAQRRAKAHGWPPPDFTSKWIEEKVLSGFCEATKIPFDLETRRSKIHASNPWVPSLDRIDSSGPYTKENVQVVVYMYNLCKSEFDHEDVVAFAKMVAKERRYGKNSSLDAI